MDSMRSAPRVTAAVYCSQTTPHTNTSRCPSATTSALCMPSVLTSAKLRGLV